MRSISLALALFALNCGSPCRDRNIAFIAAGGPLGILAAALDQCSTEDSTTPPQPVSAVATAGLAVPEQPDMASPTDMAEIAPDLSPPPPVVQPDKDGDGIPDSGDRCVTLAAGPTPDPQRPGCPKPRSYTVRLPAAAFSASGPVTVLDGAATSKAYFNWSTMKRESVALSSIVFFQNGGPNVTNAVSFELTGQADFTTPATTISSCAAFKDTLHQDASAPNPATGNPLDVACIARRIALCPVGIVSEQRQKFDEAACADNVQRGGGYWSAANAPIKLTANVTSADWNNSDPQPVPGIEIQVLFSGNVKLAAWEVVATITETLK